MSKIDRTCFHYSIPPRGLFIQITTYILIGLIECGQGELVEGLQALLSTDLTGLCRDREPLRECFGLRILS